MIERFYMAEWSREELLARLNASGRAVTARQLERWWKAGKVARPVRRHVRGLRGSISRFPAEAFDQAAAMFDASRQRSMQAQGDRRMRVRSFLLWWNGKPVAGDPREIIWNAISPMFKTLERLRSSERTLAINSDPMNEDDEAFEIAESYVANHKDEPLRGPVARRLLRNLGRRREDFFSVAITLLQTALGGYPLLGGPSLEGEPSLDSLVLRSLAANEFQKMVRVAATVAPNEGALKQPTTDETQVEELFEPISVLSDRQGLKELCEGLSDEELETARTYTRMFFEDFPRFFKAFEIVFGKNKFAGTVQILTELPTDVRAYFVLCVAWLIREKGREPFDTIAESCNRCRQHTEALLALAKTFPNYRELFLRRNIKRLEALPQEERDKMFQSIKHLLT